MSRGGVHDRIVLSKDRRHVHAVLRQHREPNNGTDQPSVDEPERASEHESVVRAVFQPDASADAFADHARGLRQARSLR